MKVIIAGTRTFLDYDLLVEECDKMLAGRTVDSVLCGECRGTDFLGKQYALARGYKVESYPADWKRFGRSAGMIRNKQMADFADCLIAFWDGVSRGTQGMINLMKKKGAEVHIVRIDKEDEEE